MGDNSPSFGTHVIYSSLAENGILYAKLQLVDKTVNTVQLGLIQVPCWTHHHVLESGFCGAQWTILQALSERLILSKHQCVCLESV